MPPLLAGEYVVAATGQHPIMLFLRKPRRFWVVLVVVTGLLALVTTQLRFVLTFAVLAAVLLTLRVVSWYCERIVLTGRRLIHVEGVVEITRTEAWLRLDRISGMRIKESVLGRLLRYATVYIEAPGDHPGVRRQFRICRATRMYRMIRDQAMAAPGIAPGQDEDDAGGYLTEPLPQLATGPRRCHICWRKFVLTH